MRQRFTHGLDLRSAKRALRSSGREFLTLFSHGTLAVELYAPHGVDKQHPHDRDEVYVIASGKGVFQLGDDRTRFSKGDFLFAPAGKRHRFVSFSNDFSTWVFFYGPKRGEKGRISNHLIERPERSRMSSLKTKETGASVTSFLKKTGDPGRRKDSLELMKLMKNITSEKPSMWGTSIVGFGRYHYKYRSGREGEWFLTGFSPRKESLTIYVMGGFQRHDALMRRLGKYKTGKSCLYIRSLDDVKRDALRTLITRSVAEMKKAK